MYTSARQPKIKGRACVFFMRLTIVLSADPLNNAVGSDSRYNNKKFFDKHILQTSSQVCGRLGAFFVER